MKVLAFGGINDDKRVCCDDEECFKAMIMIMTRCLSRCTGQDYNESDLEECFKAMCEDVIRQRKRVRSSLK